ncbi:MAG: EAL domain-containing protein [Gammaproteobacteria bacterium]
MNKVVAIMEPPAQDDYREQLAEKLEILEKLWQYIANLNTDPRPDAVTQLVGLAESLGKLVQRLGHYPEQAQLAFQLANHAKVCLASGRDLQPAQRARLRALLEQVRFSFVNADLIAAASAQSVPLAPKNLLQVEEIFVVGSELPADLPNHLERAGFRVRPLHSLAAAEAQLQKHYPLALIVQADQPEGPQAGIHMVNRLRERLELIIPVFFIANQEDITTRLAAIQAGGKGYFTRPVDTRALVEKLDKLLFNPADEGAKRALIVHDDPFESQRLSNALEHSGINTTVVSRPLRVLETIKDFQPEILIIDIDLKTVNSLELFKALRQHQSCYALPMLALCQEHHFERNLAALAGIADDVLTKPVNAEHLGWTVLQRLRRSRAVGTKLSALRNEDPLSGFFNRRYFMNQLERVLASSDDGMRVAVLMIAIDNLQALREATDFATADDSVAKAGNCLHRVLGAAAPIARFGDACFMVFVKTADVGKLQTVAQNIRKQLHEVVYMYSKGAQSVRLQACVGISAAAPGERDHFDLIQQAESACALARNNRDSGIHLYLAERDQQATAASQQALVGRIADAIKHARMELSFQPIVGLDESNQRYEALLRLKDEQNHDLFPETVFKAIQQHRLGAYLDRWVIIQCLQELRARREAQQQTTLFVNITLATIEDGDFPAWLKESMDKAGIAGCSLIFEVSEDTARCHSDKFRAFVNHLKALGCGFSLERFGQRLDSLTMLEGLMISYVKLDTHLLQDLHSPKSVAAKQLSALARSLDKLGIAPVASGVEDLHTLPTLWSSGIKFVQGYVLQKPLAEMSYNFSQC